MKLEIEIVDDKFRFSYEVGTSSLRGENKLCADDLILFSNLILRCQTHSHKVEGLRPHHD